MSARVMLTGSGYSVVWSGEHDLRDGLAKVARMYGWDVDTELVIHGWGRPDVVLWQPGTTIAVELKTVLDTPSKCRKAIQQADTYVKAMPSADHVFLVAPEINEAEMAKYQDAYPDVWVMDFGRFLGILQVWLGEDQRHITALRRHQDLVRELELSTRILADLAMSDESPLSPAPTRTSVAVVAGALGSEAPA